jgi:hypothetical protein
MKTLLLILLCLFAPACKSKQSPAEVLADKRVEIYEIVDSVRAISPDLAEQLLEILIQLENVGKRVNERDPED